MSNSGSLPEYASWRYDLTLTRFNGRADVAIRDRESGERFTHNDIRPGILDRPRRIPETEVDAVVRDMVRFADARRPAGDPIGEAARAAVAAATLRRVQDQAPEHLIDPHDYQSVLAHVADLAASLAALGAHGVAMGETCADLAAGVGIDDGRAAWSRVGTLLGRMRRRALGVEAAASTAADKVGDALLHDFTCGDCVEGICHWGGGNTPGGRPAEARRREAAGESCGCERHDVSVRMRNAAPLDDPVVEAMRLPGDPPDVEAPRTDDEALAWAGAQLADAPAGAVVDVEFAGGGIEVDPLELLGLSIDDDDDHVDEAGRIIGEWYGEHVDAAGALAGRVAAWATGTGRVPVGELADDLDDAFTAAGPQTLADLEAHMQRPPLVLTNLGSDVAALLLNGYDPRAVGRPLPPGTVIVNGAGRPFPRFAMDGAPAELDRNQLTQFAREVNTKLNQVAAEVTEAGGALFEVPGRGVLVVPAAFDLAEICIRLGVDVGAERRTRAPSDPIIIDDPVRPSGPPPVVLAKLKARGMVELTPAFGSDVMRLEVPESLADTCDSPMGCCPEHGATLRVVGGANGGPVEHTACKRPDCPRTWQGDRLGAPCDQLATYAASAPELHPQTRDIGGELAVCGGHAEQLIEWGWSVRVRRPSYMSAEDAAAADGVLALRCRKAARRTSVVAAARALFAEFGFAVRDIGDGTPSYRGEFGDVVLSITGPRLAWHAEAVFIHDRGADVFVYSTGWYHGAEGSERLSWESLVERLALVAGAELPAFVLTAREADGSVEAAAEALAAHVDAVIVLGFRAGVHGDPHHEVSVAFEGYGRRYGALFRYDVSVEALVFAGAWLADDLVVEAPLTWSSWPAFVDHVRRIAEAAEEAVD